MALHLAVARKSSRTHRYTCLAGIEDLKEKREEVNRQILQDEEEKQKIQNDLRILTERCLLPRAVSQMCWECRLTVYACPKCGLRQALAHQRLPGAQSSLAQRVRQDDHGDGGGLHENSGKLADAVARPQARKHISDQEKAGLFLRPSTGDSGRIVFWAPTTNPMPDLSPLLALIYLNYQRTQGPVSSPRALSFTSGSLVPLERVINNLTWRTRLFQFSELFWEEESKECSNRLCGAYAPQLSLFVKPGHAGLMS